MIEEKSNRAIVQQYHSSITPQSSSAEVFTGDNVSPHFFQFFPLYLNRISFKESSAEHVLIFYNNLVDYYKDLI